MKVYRGMTLTTHLHLVSGSRMSRSYNLSPLPSSAFMACSGTALALVMNVVVNTVVSRVAQSV
jgi:hypothetical protein